MKKTASTHLKDFDYQTMSFAIAKYMNFKKICHLNHSAAAIRAILNL
jgi:hypothetical protein